VAFISGRIGSSFVTAVVRGAEERAAAFGEGAYELRHYPSAGRKDGAGDAVREIFAGDRADAIVLLSVMPGTAALELIRKSSVPAVFIERKVRGMHSVTIDNYAGGYSAAMQLINSGRKKAVLITDPQCRDKGSASWERLKGFKDAMDKAGIKHDRSACACVKYHNIECGRKAFEQVAEKVRKMNGLFSVAGDLAAIGFMLEAKSSGIRIPDDLAVIGFDDIEMASAVEPALTTVRQPISRMGGVAMEIVHEALSGNLVKPEEIVLESELIIREST
jgi:LacI family transcriptional regulator